ncbi:TPM domain-containing protein [Tenacibaculum sp. 1B UA]|uniref:TPM domain-containing protein n=1 Tax=unclassified Tenacibaculum TaxID=2635139 RepID=UPI0026E3BDC0|nr:MULTISPECIES: TPM domain-containing protein [unclassified Tenacibaculum]MDO6675334.1 TPM domain-containing protein [Tenacibaculum sp. 1_MG-2023]MDX8553853.1 TPM domain-containing protein [Tenacibaculum sp. 1B UA]
MSKVEDFLTAKEEEEIVQAIREAERNTSGEIRVHIERTTEGSHYDRALEVFQMLKMFNTQQRNGVLLYIAVDDHIFVIYGDEGINNVVPDNFWETTKEAIQNQFKQGDFKQGIIDGVLKAGKELQAHFPWTTDDEDELSNEISKG